MPIQRRLVAAIAVVTILLTLTSPADPAAAASCSGNSHALTLSGGGASPGSGTTASKFTFKVTYTDNDSCAPDRIVVVVVGVGTYGLSHVSGGFQSGATFERTVTLPAGRWAYRFEATSGSGAGRRQAKLTKVSPARVIVAAPTAQPPPNPTPAPVVTPAPTPRRTPAATKAPTSPQASVEPAETEIAVTPPPTATWASPSAGAAHPAVVAPSGTAAPGAPIALLKLVVSTIGTIGGLVLFAALFGRLLRPSPAVALPPIPRRRRDDTPANADPRT